MKKKIQLSVFVLLLLCAFYINVSAQDCGCDAALAKDRIEQSEEGFEHLYYLSQIENNEYEQLKKSAEGNYKYKLLKASANYSDFKEKVKNEIKKTELETGYQYKSNYYESRTSPIAYEAWGRCMELCAGKGLILWISDEDENTIALKLRYNPPPNSSKINFTVAINHANGSSEKTVGVIDLNGTQTIYVNRRCGTKNGHTKTFVSVNGGGYSPDLTSKYFCGTPPTPPLLEEPTKTSFFLLRHDSDLYKDKPIVVRIKGEKKEYVLEKRGIAKPIPANDNDIIEVLEHPLNPEEKPWEPFPDVPKKVQYKIGDKIGQTGEFSVVKD